METYLSPGSLFGIKRLCRVILNHVQRDIFLFIPQTHFGFFFLHTFECQCLNKFSVTIKDSAFMLVILKTDIILMLYRSQLNDKVINIL